MRMRVRECAGGRLAVEGVCVGFEYGVGNVGMSLLGWMGWIPRLVCNDTSALLLGEVGMYR